MLLSKKLLTDFFKEFKKVTDQDLAKAINSIGAEVESIYKFEKVNNLIVGQITHVEKHPKSEKLNLCKVLVNNKERTIICGAKNVKVNAKVIVALEGAKMVDGREIQYKELLGIKSEGMICAYSELTSRIDFLTSEDSQNIIILDPSAKLNDTDPLKYINLDDTIFDLSLPSNRNELNGLIGLVYDFIPHLNIKKEFDFSLDFKSIKKNKIKLNVDKEISPFFGTIELSNLSVNESSWKVKSYLMNSGIKPVNWLVDIGNLNMIITGNGSHCYDKKAIGNEITIKKSNSTKKFVALNDKEYSVDKNAILIESQNKTICLGGIIGSKDSSVNSNTNAVVFEVASFDNLLIRKTSEQINLKTDASNLFSKKIPLWITLKSFETLINLLQQSKANFEGISFTNFQLKEKTIKFDWKKINSILGKQLKEQEIKKFLISIGFKISNSNLIVPIYREDISNIYDVAEEILKRIGIDNLEPQPVVDSIVSFKENEFENNLDLISDYLQFKGFTKVKTYNLTSFESVNKFNLFKAKKIEKVLNPLSKEREYLRTSLVSQMLNVFSHNKSYKNQLVPIFEIQGLTYDEKWHQHLGVIIPCEIFNNNITKSKLNNDIFLMKSIIADLFKYLNVEYDFVYGTNDNDLLIAKNDSLTITNKKGKVIGVIGRLSPEIVPKSDLEEKYYFAEIVCDDFINKQLPNTFEAKGIDFTHKVSRYLTVTLSENQNYKDLEEKILNIDSIENYSLIDIYKNENEISYTFDLNFKKTNSQLTLEEINNTFNSVINSLEKNGYIIKK